VNPPRSTAFPARREAGFTLAELIVTLIVLVEIALAMLLLFDASTKLGKAEMQVADMQQSLRIGQYEVVRMVRMAGRGGLPAANVPATAFAANLFAGAAIAVRNNVPTGTGVIAGTAPTDPPTFANPRVLAGTDVLTIRGVFSTPLYQVNTANPGVFTYDAASGKGKVIISSVSPTGVLQPFDSTNAPGSFADALGLGATPPRPEYLILVSSLDDTIYGVAQLDPKASSIIPSPPPPATQTGPPQTATLVFNTNGVVGSALSANGAFPPTLNNVAYVGLLEEYRYYVREVHAKPGDLTSEPTPVLSRARFYPGTDDPWNGDPTSLYQDIAEGVIDLQVALGFDRNTPVDGVVTEDNPPSKTDEVLFNTPADDASSAPWNPPPNPFPPLFWVRVNVLVRTNRHDVQYRAPTVVSIEDHLYNPNPTDPWDPNGKNDRDMRRRLAQTVVALRNRL
jgi:Type IV Pilus-assembly protein W